MELSLEQLLEYAEDHKVEMFAINDSIAWLASRCINSLLNLYGLERECMGDWWNFSASPHSVATEYGDLTKELFLWGETVKHIEEENPHDWSGKQLAEKIKELIQKRDK